MKKYNIAKPEKYTKDGVEKTYWANVGTMTEFEKQDGPISRIIEIPAIGLKANVFEKREPEQKGQTGHSEAKSVSANSEIDTDAIPF